MKTIMTMVIITILGSYGVDAAPITLNPSILPSNQGWDYSAVGLHSGSIETNVFSVGGSVLNINSMGLSLSSITGGSIVYRNSNVVTSALPTTLEWTSRTLEYERNVAAAGQDFGFIAGFRSENLIYHAGISTNEITLIDGAGYKYISVDATEYHTYRIDTIAGAPSYDFYIDDVLQVSATARTGTSANNIYFGDGTGGANSNTDITDFEFNQIPEPATMGLLMITGLFIYFGRRRLNK